jgi:hypothetical protein
LPRTKRFIAVVAKYIDLHFGFVPLVPFAFLLKENITGGAPRIGLLILIVDLHRKPLLGWVREEVLADVGRKANSVCRAI